MDETIYYKIYLTVAMFFAIGGAAVYWFFPQDSNLKQLKIKYWVYLLIVIVHLLLLQKYIYGFWILSILILFLGFYEISKLFTPLIKIGDLKTGIISQIIYLLTGWCYFHFILMDSITILYTYLLVITFDGSSQLTGIITGKNKMFVQISPGKTWEGLAGGIFGSLTIVLLFRKEFDFEFWNMILKWIIIIAFAFAGDTLASLLKRRVGIKDFSRLIPGHGGVIDRFDSLMIAGTAVYIGNIIFEL